MLHTVRRWLPKTLKANAWIGNHKATIRLNFSSAAQRRIDTMEQVPTTERLNRLRALMKENVVDIYSQLRVVDAGFNPNLRAC